MELPTRPLKLPFWPMRIGSSCLAHPLLPTIGTAALVEVPVPVVGTFEVDDPVGGPDDGRAGAAAPFAPPAFTEPVTEDEGAPGAAAGAGACADSPPATGASGSAGATVPSEPSLLG
ncbi:hypothetical protein GCM10009547_43300 [Sporichthya brevicatena]|uniref:Secreted protein n=1 Tax=Sporichthya brevicatena TaxID=171442 RepID=A0ABN1H9N4_9ACTN